MQRHFFTTSHGKGPYDGVGGSVKRHVKRASVQIIGKHVFTLVGILTSVWRTLQEYIKDEEVKVVGRYASATTVPNTRQHDCFISTGTNKIECTVCQVAQTTQKSAHQKLFPLN
jgi:hypothetical protein